MGSQMSLLQARLGTRHSKSKRESHASSSKLPSPPMIPGQRSQKDSPVNGSIRTQTSEYHDHPPLPPPKTYAVGGSAAGTADSWVPEPRMAQPQTHSNSNSPRPTEFAMPQASTVPCQYRTGRTLGSGTYAIVKEAIHIKTGKYYACKVINKKLMEGREHMVRNEIAVLKKVSSGHKNIVTLHDYFETSHNLYLCFDLCTGGELFDSICAKGHYYEADAASLIRTIFEALLYIHDCGIVHRDLKPENLIFRTKAPDADIMIADFGLSRVMDESKLSLLTEVCGTPGYMAPEIFKKIGHGKPVDVWAMGVIVYFLLAGYTPFDRDTQQQEMEAIIAGDYAFEPEEYWSNVSETARSFVRECLTIDPANRPTAREALNHKWLASEQPHFVPDPDKAGGPTDLLPHVRKAFDARKTFRKAVLGMMAMRRMSTLASHHLTAEQRVIEDTVFKFKEESAKEVMEHATILHHHEEPTSPRSPHASDGLRNIDNVALGKPNPEPPVQELASATLSDKSKSVA